MSPEEYKPSAWENPDYYEKLESSPEPQRERSLREYIEMQLSASGFAVDQHPEGILAWPRGRNASDASIVVGERKGTYVVVKSEGTFTRRKIQKALTGYLQNWVKMYNMGART